MPSENCNVKVHRQMCFCRTLFCLNVSNSCIFMSYVRKVVKDVSSQQPRNKVTSVLQPYLLSYSEETFLHGFIMGGASQQIAFYTQEFTCWRGVSSPPMLGTFGKTTHSFTILSRFYF